VRTLVAIMIMVLMATSSAFARKPHTLISNARRSIVSRRLRQMRAALNAIQTTSRLIE
jgi:hypothetical protein